MTTPINEYKLASFKKLTSLNEKDNLWIVMDSVTESRYVMRKLPETSLEVYEVLKTINHPHIIEIKDIFLHNGFLYVIEEYLEWSRISDEAAKKKFSRRRVFSIGKQLFGALSTLHEHNIIHRDIKPDNIMIDKNDNVKLIDFDVARIFSENKSRDTVVKGSMDYASPEQFGYSQTDSRADIYSLGITLNELATGTFPDNKICSGRLGIVIRRCIEFDPNRRYRTAGQALKHMKWLERRKILIIAGIAAAVGVTAFAVTGVFLTAGKTLPLLEKRSDDKASSGNTDTSSEDTGSSGDDKTSGNDKSPDLDVDQETKAYDETIVRGNAWRFPYIMMTQDEKCSFLTDEEDEESAIEVLVSKMDKKLDMICNLKDGSKAEFQFDDIYPYETWNPVKDAVPEYEILMNDFNGDGETDLCVAYSYRKLLETYYEEYSYYNTDHSIIWLIYSDGPNSMTCSEPLFFHGELPSYEQEALFEATEGWYYLVDGKWEMLNN